MEKKTTSTAAKQVIREHIARQLQDTYTSYEELKEQLNALRDNQTFTDYHAGSRLVEGGCLLIYNVDIEKFLLDNGFTTEEHIKKYEDGKNILSPFDFYKHLIAREIQTADRWYNETIKQV